MIELIITQIKETKLPNLPDERIDYRKHIAELVRNSIFRRIFFNDFPLSLLLLHNGACSCPNIAAYTQLITSSPNFVCANQMGYNHLKDDVILGGPMTLEQGCIKAPSGSEIGVELNPRKVQEYSSYFHEKVKGKESKKTTNFYQLMSCRSFFKP